MTEDRSLLVLSLRPGVRALTAVMAVLHSRGAEVDGLQYEVGDGAACLLVRCALSPGPAGTLARQLDRKVDVLSIEVRTCT